MLSFKDDVKIVGEDIYYKGELVAIIEHKALAKILEEFKRRLERINYES